MGWTYTLKFGMVWRIFWASLGQFTVGWVFNTHIIKTKILLIGCIYWHTCWPFYCRFRVIEILEVVSGYLGVWQWQFLMWVLEVVTMQCYQDFWSYHHGSLDFGDNYWVLFKDISENRVYVFTHCSYRKESFTKVVHLCLRIIFYFLGYG